MLKLLYIAKVNFIDNSCFGVQKKINQQINVFSKYFITDIIYYSNNYICLNNNKLSCVEKKNTIKIRNLFYKELKKIIHNYDVIYMRNFISDPKIINIFTEYKGIKLLEIPTNVDTLFQETKNIFAKLMITFYQKRLMNKFDLIFVNGNLSEFEKKLKKDIIIIQNGIDCSEIKIKQSITKNENINLISVSNNSLWHGYDRIIKGLFKYYKNDPKKEVYYHCVGEGSELANLMGLTKELNLEKYVIFHGTKTGKDLDKVVDGCDISFGSLGNHRKGLYVDSALKNREYCARGIPFVIASDDQDFPETFPFVYRIPKDDTPVDIHQVIKWYESLIKEHPNYSMEMRKFAEENLSWDAKMEPILEKIKSLSVRKHTEVK